jgi:hypothetical protein
VKSLIPLCVSFAALTLGGCAGDYGYGGGVYAGGPYAYEGFYDDFYGPIYDGYWGNDGFFYFRNGVGDGRFRRGDAAHFRRAPGAGANFHAMRGSMTPAQRTRMPHFGGARGLGGGRGRR